MDYMDDLSKKFKQTVSGKQENRAHTTNIKFCNPCQGVGLCFDLMIF